MGNIMEENRRINKANRSRGKDVLDQEEVGLDDPKEFREFSKRMKEMANQQIPGPEYLAQGGEDG